MKDLIKGLGLRFSKKRRRELVLILDKFLDEGEMLRAEGAEICHSPEFALELAMHTERLRRLRVLRDKYDY